jgi:geranylgeranyl diphosphate synthase type II
MLDPSLSSARDAAEKALLGIADLWEAQGGFAAACAYAIRMGGKRVRPSIAIGLSRMLVGSCIDSRTDGALCQAAIGVELLHLASLVADDLPCMDNDDERRGLPAFHRKYSESTALLASYALIARGYELLASAALLAPCQERAMLAVSRIAGCGGVSGACEGQYLDLELAAGRSADRMRMLRLKTGALFEMAFICGWGFGGQTDVKLDQISSLAETFGLAFQLLDDLKDRWTDGLENSVTEWGADSVVARAALQIGQFRSQLERIGWYEGAMKELSSWLESSLQRAGHASTSAASVTKAGLAACALE